MPVIDGSVVGNTLNVNDSFTVWDSANMANVGNQLPTQAVSKPPSGKHGNVLPLWGNEKTMNLNPMILTNVLSSPYFKVQLYELKTYHEVVDEIYFKVTPANAKPHASQATMSAQRRIHCEPNDLQTGIRL